MIFDARQMDSSNENTDGVARYIKRILDLPTLLKKKSYFLFGPCRTGKAFLILWKKQQVKGPGQLFFHIK